jgi:S1-C subfamily serine protease
LVTDFHLMSSVLLQEHSFVLSSSPKGLLLSVLNVPLTSAYDESYGIYVQSLTEGGEAQRIGLLVGDIVKEANGVPLLRNMNDTDQG